MCCLIKGSDGVCVLARAYASAFFFFFLRAWCVVCNAFCFFARACVRVYTGTALMVIPHTHLPPPLLSLSFSPLASNIYDEEPGDDEIEYSDDEEEAEARKRAKALKGQNKRYMYVCVTKGRQSGKLLFHFWKFTLVLPFICYTRECGDV